MNDSGNASGRGLGFILLWAAIANGTPYSGESFLLALMIVGMGWLAGQMFRSAVSRLGEHAWSMLCQLIGLAIVVVWLYPGPFGLVLFWVAAAGLPLWIAGFLAHHYASRIAFPGWVLQRAALALLVNAVVFLGIWTHSITLPIFWTAGAAVVFVFGWMLGAPYRVTRHDAHMGREEEFESAGYSRDR